jgi:hypothetical protein
MRARLPWALWGVFVALLAVSVSLHIASSGPTSDSLVFMPCLLGFVTVGALIALRRPDNRIGWILVSIALIIAAGLVIDDALHASADPASLRFAAWVESWSYWLWIALGAVFMPLLFPTGELSSPRWRFVPSLAVAAVALSIVGSAFAPGALDVDVHPKLQNPLGITGASGLLDALQVLGGVLLVASVAAAVASLAQRLRRAKGEERQQVKWLAYVGSVILAAFAVALGFELIGSSGWPHAVSEAGWVVAFFSLIVGMPAATGIAILRYRLYDIDVVIRRTLVYGALTAILAAVYVGSVLLLQLALNDVTSDSSLAVAASTLGVAALFRPARARIQAVVDRRFYRRKYDAARTLEDFSSRLREQVDLDALGGELHRVVADTMQPAHLSLWLREARR